MANIVTLTLEVGQHCYMEVIMQENSPAALARIQQLINKIVLVIAHGPIAAAKRALAAAVKERKKQREKGKRKKRKKRKKKTLWRSFDRSSVFILFKQAGICLGLPA